MCPLQEYIEIEGAGILLSPEFGLVLFHLDHVWYEGEKVLQLEFLLHLDHVWYEGEKVL